MGRTAFRILEIWRVRKKIYPKPHGCSHCRLIGKQRFSRLPPTLIILLQPASTSSPRLLAISMVTTGPLDRKKDNCILIALRQLTSKLTGAC